MGDELGEAMRSLLCFLLGGHSLGLPKVIDGRYRRACQYGCGYMTTGIETRGMERQRVNRNLILYRSQHSIWQGRERKIA